MSKKNLPEILAYTLPDLGVQPGDAATIEYRNGFAKATIKKAGSGEVYTQRVYSKGGYQSMTAFNPADITRDEMIELVKDMKTSDPQMTQTAIADELGISQSSVSNYLKKGNQ